MFRSTPLQGTYLLSTTTVREPLWGPWTQREYFWTDQTSSLSLDDNKQEFPRVVRKILGQLTQRLGIKRADTFLLNFLWETHTHWYSYLLGHTSYPVSFVSVHSSTLTVSCQGQKIIKNLTQTTLYSQSPITKEK